jgi:hypothetical protein
VDPADVERFRGMLRDVYLPVVVKGAPLPTTNGNWELTMIEATIGIGVFLDDRATFNKALSMWRARVPPTSTSARTARPPGHRQVETCQERRSSRTGTGRRCSMDGVSQDDVSRISVTCNTVSRR